jgi:hypothetical protein
MASSRAVHQGVAPAEKGGGRKGVAPGGKGWRRRKGVAPAERGGAGGKGRLVRLGPAWAGTVYQGNSSRKTVSSPLSQEMDAPS